jgi:hypothetical protein
MLTKMISFAMAMASRGLSNSKVDVSTKQLRVVSCFGYEDIPACQNLKKSKTEGMHYCGGCGCGDRKQTWLIQNSSEYSKLDYPKLDCPLKMPGFSNYDPAFKNSRKQQIEKLEPTKLSFVNVTIGSNPVQEKIMEQAIKYKNNK